MLHAMTRPGTNGLSTVTVVHRPTVAASYAAPHNSLTVTLAGRTLNPLSSVARPLNCDPRGPPHRHSDSRLGPRRQRIGKSTTLVRAGLQVEFTPIGWPHPFARPTAPSLLRGHMRGTCSLKRAQSIRASYNSSSLTGVHNHLTHTSARHPRGCSVIPRSPLASFQRFHAHLKCF